MGTENLHHKRKAAQKNERSTVKKAKSSRGRILIICEDSDSSPNYFKRVCQCFGLGKQTRVEPSPYSDPRSVVGHAKKQLKEDFNAVNDKIFIVIDRDRHAHYLDTIQRAKDKNIIPIVSIPCFEYWILLHFEYTSAPFEAKENSSPCDEVVKKLRKHLHDYDKGKFFTLHNYNTYLKPHENTAIENAKRRAKEVGHENKYEANPYTDIYVLMDELYDLKNR